jgi:hypothetical protein
MTFGTRLPLVSASPLNRIFEEAIFTENLCFPQLTSLKPAHQPKSLCQILRRAIAFL